MRTVSEGRMSVPRRGGKMCGFLFLTAEPSSRHEAPLRDLGVGHLRLGRIFSYTFTLAWTIFLHLHGRGCGHISTRESRTGRWMLEQELATDDMPRALDQVLADGKSWRYPFPDLIEKAIAVSKDCACLMRIFSPSSPRAQQDQYFF